MESGEIAEKKSVRQYLPEIDAMMSKLKFEPNVDCEEKKKQREGPEPAPDIEHGDRRLLIESISLANQDLPNQEPAENEKQLHPIEAAMTKYSNESDQVRIEDDKSMRANDTCDCRGSKNIEPKNTIAPAGFARRRDLV
jgi:hypothetical protein